MSFFVTKIRRYGQRFRHKFTEAIFVSRNQYRLKFLNCFEANSQLIAVLQVVIKRVRTKFSLRYVACNPLILNEIHPVDVLKITFMANVESSISFEQIPAYITMPSENTSVIKQPPTLKIISQSFCNNETIFTVTDINSNYQKTLSATELAKIPKMIYSLGSQEAARVGISASNDFLTTLPKETSTGSTNLIKTHSYQYYHILCISYVTLILTGINIVRRMFPFYIPFTDIIVPFGGGVIFFPITFFIQDITTEVYGFNAARQMLLLSMYSVLFFVVYSQIVIHLPTESDLIYRDNAAFFTVFSTQPRQVIALLVSLFFGFIVNDFFISRSKVILAGQYLWVRILGSTMLGEAVLQIIGGIIGFSDKLDFKTQLLPNMILAYAYKILWCSATIPLIYLISNFLKRKEGLDVFDYDVKYNPFNFNIFSK